MPLERSFGCVLPGNAADGKPTFSVNVEEPDLTGFLVFIGEGLLKSLLAMTAPFQQNTLTWLFAWVGLTGRELPAALGPNLDRIGPAGEGGANLDATAFRRIADFHFILL